MEEQIVLGVGHSATGGKIRKEAAAKIQPGEDGGWLEGAAEVGEVG